MKHQIKESEQGGIKEREYESIDISQQALIHAAARTIGICESNEY